MYDTLNQYIPRACRGTRVLSAEVHLSSNWKSIIISDGILSVTMSCYEHCHANQNVRRSGKHNSRAFSSLTSPSSRHWRMDCLQQSMLKWLSYFLIRFPTCRVVSIVLPFLFLFSFPCKKVHKFQC